MGFHGRFLPSDVIKEWVHGSKSLANATVAVITVQFGIPIVPGRRGFYQREPFTKNVAGLSYLENV